VTTVAAGRSAVVQVRARFAGLSERRACKYLGTPLSSQRFRSVRTPDTAVRTRLKELAGQYVRWGLPMLLTLLRREGWIDNHKRIERIYKEEQLKVRRRKRKRVAVERRPVPVPTRVNECWAIDFMHDVFSTGRRYRIFNVLDLHGREGLSSESDTSLPSRRVVDLLDAIALERGSPERIVCDNGPEFRSRVFDAWAYEHGITIEFIQPGKPTQNPSVESFNGKMRNEWINAHWWRTIEEARQGNEEFRRIYNTVRPHRSLGNKTPAKFAAANRSQLKPQAVGT
jgi:putative transposase